MKNFNEFINESKDQQSKLGKKILNLLGKDDKFSQLGKKIFKALGKDSSDIVSAILKRNERWDENKFEFSREPMFLVAGASNKNKLDSGETTRDLAWVREKFFDSSLDSDNGIEGTLSDYNISNDEGDVPRSVLGIYFDRQFYPITSLETYKLIRDIIENKE